MGPWQWFSAFLFAFYTLVPIENGWTVVAFSLVSFTFWGVFRTYQELHVLQHLDATPLTYTTPYRPLVIHVVNAIFRLPGLRSVPASWLTEQALCALAIKRSHGLTEFAEPGSEEDKYWRKGFRKLLEAVRVETQLTPWGSFMLRERLCCVLMNRLRAQWYFKTYPDILENTSIDKIVVIAGLPRTGTTKLQRLLCADTRFRHLRAWEALNPAPLLSRAEIEWLRSNPGGEVWNGDGNKSMYDAVFSDEKRLAEAETNAKALAFLAPHFFAVHPCEANAPEEDVLLMDLSFHSVTFEATINVPSYGAWLEQQDLTLCYRYIRKLLQLLSWQQSHRENQQAHDKKQQQQQQQQQENIWLLKTPAHLSRLTELSSVFPEYHIIHTHREPNECVVSFWSMTAHTFGIFSDKVPCKDIATTWLRKNAEALQSAIEFRQERKARFSDVYYREAMNDWQSVLQRLYKDDLKRTLPEEQLEHITDTFHANKQHKYGVHVYSHESFDVSSNEIDQAFKPYLSHYHKQDKRFRKFI